MLDRKAFEPIWLSNGKLLAEPEDFAISLDVEKGILCFTPHTFYALVDDLGLHKEAPDVDPAKEGKMSDAVVVYYSSFGAPAASMLLEILIASGIDKVIMCGSAGSISPTCTIGEIFLPTWGLREEGTSYHYLSADITPVPSEILLEKVKRELNEDFVEGGVWTTDAYFRETKDKIKRYSKKGVVAVDMECTALMSIAMYRNIDFTAVLAISDELWGEVWKTGWDSNELKEAKETITHALLKVWR